MIPRYHILLVVWMLLLCRTLTAQPDYISYNRNITSISLLIYQGNEAEALLQFDTVFNQYEHIYTEHVYMGTQLAAKLGNDTCGYKYLTQLLYMGVSSKVIFADSLITRLHLRNPQRWDSLFARYNLMQEQRKQTPGNAYKATIDSVYLIDQQLTRKLNSATILLPYYWVKWRRQNKRHIRFMRPLIQANGYPGERVMGLATYSAETDSTRRIRYGANTFVVNHQMLIMLVHYFSNNRNDFNKELLEQVTLGNMTAYDYGSVNDFLARWGKRRYKTFYCNVWHKAPEKLRNQVNLNRSAIGLCNLDYKEAYQQYWRELIKKKQEHTVVYLPGLFN